MCYTRIRIFECGHSHSWDDFCTRFLNARRHYDRVTCSFQDDVTRIRAPCPDCAAILQQHRIRRGSSVVIDSIGERPGSRHSNNSHHGSNSSHRSNSRMQIEEAIDSSSSESDSDSELEDPPSPPPRRRARARYGSRVPSRSRSRSRRRDSFSSDSNSDDEEEERYMGRGFQRTRRQPGIHIGRSRSPAGDRENRAREAFTRYRSPIRPRTPPPADRSPFRSSSGFRPRSRNGRNVYAPRELHSDSDSDSDY